MVQQELIWTFAQFKLVGDVTDEQQARVQADRLRRSARHYGAGSPEQYILLTVANALSPP